MRLSGKVVENYSLSKLNLRSQHENRVSDYGGWFLVADPRTMGRVEWWRIIQAIRSHFTLFPAWSRPQNYFYYLKVTQMKHKNMNITRQEYQKEEGLGAEDRSLSSPSFVEKSRETVSAWRKGALFSIHIVQSATSWRTYNKMQQHAHLFEYCIVTTAVMISKEPTTISELCTLNAT